MTHVVTAASGPSQSQAEAPRPRSRQRPLTKLEEKLEAARAIVQKATGLDLSQPVSVGSVHNLALREKRRQARKRSQAVSSAWLPITAASAASIALTTAAATAAAAAAATPAVSDTLSSSPAAPTGASPQALQQPPWLQPRSQEVPADVEQPASQTQQQQKLGQIRQQRQEQEQGKGQGQRQQQQQQADQAQASQRSQPGTAGPDQAQASRLLQSGPAGPGSASQQPTSASPQGPGPGTSPAIPPRSSTAPSRPGAQVRPYHTVHRKLLNISFLNKSTDQWERDKNLYYSPLSTATFLKPQEWVGSLRKHMASGRGPPARRPGTAPELEGPRPLTSDAESRPRSPPVSRRHKHQGPSRPPTSESQQQSVCVSLFQQRHPEPVLKPHANKWNYGLEPHVIRHLMSVDMGSMQEERQAGTAREGVEGRAAREQDGVADAPGHKQAEDQAEVVGPAEGPAAAKEDENGDDGVEQKETAVLEFHSFQAAWEHQRSLQQPERQRSARMRKRGSGTEARQGQREGQDHMQTVVSAKPEASQQQELQQSWQLQSSRHSCRHGSEDSNDNRAGSSPLPAEQSSSKLGEQPPLPLQQSGLQQHQQHLQHQQPAASEAATHISPRSSHSRSTPQLLAPRSSLRHSQASEASAKCLPVMQAETPAETPSIQLHSQANSDASIANLAHSIPAKHQTLRVSISSASQAHTEGERCFLGQQQLRPKPSVGDDASLGDGAQSPSRLPGSSGPRVSPPRSSNSNTASPRCQQSSKSSNCAQQHATTGESSSAGALSRHYVAVGDMWNPQAVGAVRPDRGMSHDYVVGVYNRQAADTVVAIMAQEEEAARRQLLTDRLERLCREREAAQADHSVFLARSKVTSPNSRRTGLTEWRNSGPERCASPPTAWGFAAAPARGASPLSPRGKRGKVVDTLPKVTRMLQHLSNLMSDGVDSETSSMTSSLGILPAKAKADAMNRPVTGQRPGAGQGQGQAKAPRTLRISHTVLPRMSFGELGSAVCLDHTMQRRMQDALDGGRRLELCERALT